MGAAKKAAIAKRKQGTPRGGRPPTGQGHTARPCGGPLLPRSFGYGVLPPPEAAAVASAFLALGHFRVADPRR